MKKQLIINADDFGIHEAVNLAVYRGFESGILTSTSIMAGGDAFSSAVRLSREMGNIGIGIHLTLVGTLTTVLPAEEVPTLTWEKGVLCKDYLELILRDMKGLIIRSMAGTGLAFIARRHRSVLKQMNVKTNDYFYGMLYGGHLTEDRIINLLSRVKSGVTEIMCHPSSNEQEMDRQFRWGYHGESELQALLSTTVKEKIDEESIDLISYRDVAIEGISAK